MSEGWNWKERESEEIIEISWGDYWNFCNISIFFDLSQLEYTTLFFFFLVQPLLSLPTHLPPPLCTHAQSCNPMDCSPPDSSVHGLFQARILEWVAISFSRENILLLWRKYQRANKQKSVYCISIYKNMFFIIAKYWK